MTSERTGWPLTGVSQRGYMNALRTSLHFCAREEWLDERIPQRLDMPRQERKVLQVLSAEQVRLLFRATAASEAPMRDRALLAVLLDGGLRVAELCRLTLDDAHFERDDAWLMLHGKGRKEREVPLGRTARAHLHRYMHREREAPSRERHVFLGRRGPLTQIGVDRALYGLRDEAGARHFAGVRVSAHVGRHTFAVNFLVAGGDVCRLARLMGHSAVAVTERYLIALSAKQARTGGPSVPESL
jgi:site-specific recombinase XerD